MSAADRVVALTCATLDIGILDSTLIVTIEQPETMNALAPAVITELRSVFGLLAETLGKVAPDATEPDWSIRGVVLTGAGERAFVAGADIRALSAMADDEVRDYASSVHELFGWFESLPVPVIAAVNGYALGGGCEIALACDMIFASENAKFGQPEVALGIIPGFGGCVRLQRAIGPGAAREMIFTGRHVPASEALSFGLVQRVLPDVAQLRDAVLDTIGLVAQQSPAAVATAKRTMNEVRASTIADGLAAELNAFASRFGSPDMTEGTAAFLEKRPAVFPGA